METTAILENLPQRRFRRRTFLINPGFQLRFMLYVVAFVLIGFGVMYVGNYYYLSAVYEMGRELDLDSSHPYFEFIDMQKLLLQKVYLGVSAASFAVIMTSGLFLSHRIAGPIYRIVSYMDEVVSGKTNMRPVKLREGDFFPEIADALNKVIDYYEHKKP